MHRHWQHLIMACLAVVGFVPPFAAAHSPTTPHPMQPLVHCPAVITAAGDTCAIPGHAEPGITRPIQFEAFPGNLPAPPGYGHLELPPVDATGPWGEAEQRVALRTMQVEALRELYRGPQPLAAVESASGRIPGTAQAPVVAPGRDDQAAPKWFVEQRQTVENRRQIEALMEVWADGGAFPRIAADRTCSEGTACSGGQSGPVHSQAPVRRRLAQSPSHTPRARFQRSSPPSAGSPLEWPTLSDGIVAPLENVLISRKPASGGR